MDRRNFMQAAASLGLTPALGGTSYGSPATSGLGAQDLVLQSPGAVIKVIGVGGGGADAVEEMIYKGIYGVAFIVTDTHAQSLKRSGAQQIVPIKASLTARLSTDANPEVGHAVALQDRELIAASIRDADMLFIVGGMGGGTGTSAAPVIARIAKDMGILTIAVVTMPFSYEAGRMKVAAAGIEALRQHVDSLIIIPNDQLLDVLHGYSGDRYAYHAANSVQHRAVASICEMINLSGLVGADFTDMKMVTEDMGRAMVGSATAWGADRARQAAEHAVASPLLGHEHLFAARGAIVNISAGASMKLQEVHDVMTTIRNLTADDTVMVFGTVIDPSLGDALRVSVIATGLGYARSNDLDSSVIAIKGGRFALPPGFAVNDSTVVVAGHPSGCLSLYRVEEWILLRDKLVSMTERNNNPALQSRQRLLLGYSENVQVSRHGIVEIDAGLLEFANISDQLVWVPKRHHVQLWGGQLSHRP